MVCHQVTPWNNELCLVSQTSWILFSRVLQPPPMFPCSVDHKHRLPFPLLHNDDALTEFPTCWACFLWLTDTSQHVLFLTILGTQEAVPQRCMLLLCINRVLSVTSPLSFNHYQEIVFRRENWACAPITLQQVLSALTEDPEWESQSLMCGSWWLGPICLMEPMCGPGSHSDSASLC